MDRPTEADLATRPIMNRNPWPVDAEWPRSVSVVNRPAEILPDTEALGQWSVNGMFDPRPHLGGYDGLGGRLMHVAHADMYDSSPNPWPNNGQYDHPNVIAVVAAIMRKPPSTSAHPGFSMSTKRGDPTSLFSAPPVFSIQTRPIPAVGV